MQIRINFSRPDFIFSLVWLTTMVLNFSFQTIYTVPANIKVTLLIFSNIIGSIAIYYFFNTKVYRMAKSQITPVNVVQLNQLKKWTYIIVSIWFVGFAINIAFSKGVPLYWKLIGDSRTYTEFGVPSFSGLLNAIRLFSSVSLMIILIHRFKIIDAFLLVVLLVSSLLELSRGNFTFLLLTVLGVIFLYKRFNWKMILLFLLGILGFLVFFGYLGNIRGSSGEINSILSENSIFKNIPNIFIWGFTYITSPLNNLNYAAEWINPTFWPRYTTIGLVPTVVRESLFGVLTYPIHIADASLNATTFYSPLIADFGFGFTFIIVTLIQIYMTIIYLKAKSGKLMAALMYPILLSSIMLSVFYMYLFTLMVIFYITLSWLVSALLIPSQIKVEE